tara:strand:- start:892 stop:1668 length:777 start_codon:yes stop_codon:yes gene_type:complete
MKENDFAALAQADENQTRASMLITEIRHLITDTEKANYATHYLIGIVFGGSRWGKEVPGKVLIELQELCQKVREKGFPELEDKYFQHLKAKRWVPLWYVNHHFHSIFSHLVENRRIDEIIRENTLEGDAVRPVMGYVSDPLSSVSPDKIANIHNVLVEEANQARRPNPDISKMGVKGRNNGDEIMDLIELIRSTEDNEDAERVFTLDHYLLEGLRLFRARGEVEDEVIDEVIQGLENCDQMILITIDDDGKTFWTETD